jgi:hypothetical protein
MWTARFDELDAVLFEWPHMRGRPHGQLQTGPHANCPGATCNELNYSVSSFDRLSATFNNINQFAQCFVTLQTGYLSLLGGTEIADTTSRILRALITNELALEYNYCGRKYKGEQRKKKFKSLRLKKVIIGECLCNNAQLI